MNKLTPEEVNKIVDFSIRKQFLTVTEASLYTGFCVSYLYQLVFQKKLPYYKPGRKLFFRVTELDEWISNSRVMPMNEIEEEAVQSLSQKL